MVKSHILPSLPRLDRKIRECQMPMSLFNPQCTGYWDASFEINNNQVHWKAKTDTKTILYNYMLPPDHMTRCVIPLFAARGLLADLEIRLATDMSQMYQDARANLSAVLDYDMRCCILFLNHKRSDLKPFEVLWCAVSGVLKLHKPAFDRFIQAPAKIRQRVKQDGITAFRKMIKDPDFDHVDQLLWNAMRVLEIYTRPLVTGEPAFLWIDSPRLGNIDVMYDLSLDGAKARKTLFDYLEERHPGSDSTWHNLVQNYHSHDVVKFPEYATRPRSIESIFTWVEFFTEARQGVLLKTIDFVGSDPIKGDGQKKPKKKNKSRKRKGAKSEEQPVLLEQCNEHPASHEQHSQKEGTTSQEEPSNKVQPTTQEQHTSLEQVVPQEPTPRVVTPLQTLEESSEQNEQKQKRKEKKQKDKVKKSEATRQAISATVKEPPSSVVAKDDSDGDSVTGNTDKDSEGAIGNNHNRAGNVVIGNGYDLDGHMSAADSVPSDEAPTNQKTVQEHPNNRYEVLKAKPPEPAGNSAGKLASHVDSEDDMKKAMEESLLNDPDSWSKVQGRAKLRPKQKQKQHTDDRKSIQDAYRQKGYASAATNVQPARARAEAKSAKVWAEYARSQPTGLSALMPGEGSSKPIKEQNSTARWQPKSWSALFNPAENDTGRNSPQEATLSTNAVDMQPRTAMATENRESIQESAQSASPHALAQSEPPVEQEEPNDLKPSKAVAGAGSTPTSGTEISGPIKETVLPVDPQTITQSERPVYKGKAKDFALCEDAAGARSTPAASSAFAKNQGSTEEIAQPAGSHSFAQTRSPMDAEAPEHHHSHEDSSRSPASPHVPAPLQRPVSEEEPKDYSGHEEHAESLAEDDISSQPSTGVDSAMSHVEQWLATRYAAAFDGLTQAEIENAHWRPEQSAAI
ncbi:hypothetical protein BKA58DRAFT_26722 [Alternaria rosae]|uniref:uncharacterized protein n=1 Tax=Alternaria rosae TaxID=1187941 RepID=UPI001E8DC685|nr:uncharacterized protein BKA58DRAFT_26722 [Alternaria rosae]KAH6882906.1 hypothetical protein BKA58DRAFT_26722 [Alternaria rosae]